MRHSYRKSTGVLGTRLRSAESLLKRRDAGKGHEALSEDEIGEDEIADEKCNVWISEKAVPVKAWTKPIMLNAT